MLHLLPIIKLIADLVGVAVQVVLTAYEILRLVKPVLANGKNKNEAQVGSPELGRLPKRDRDGKAGYVYVVQEVDYSKQFKIGRTIDPTGRLDKVDLIVPGQVKPVLIIPTTDAHALEKELHRKYTKDRKRGEWFELNQSQLSELRQLQDVVDLATGTRINPNHVMDPDTIEKSRRLFELLSRAAGGMYESDLAEEKPTDAGPDISSQDLWDLRSIPVANYHDLPKLGRRSGYICVLRDIDCDKYLIDGTDHPSKVIDAAFAEKHGTFGLELLLILETTNIKNVAKWLAILYSQLEYRQWIELSPNELQEIRNLASPDYIHGSTYLTPKTHWGIASLPVGSFELLPKVSYPAGYLCIVNGVKSGMRYKIWTTRHPKQLSRNRRLGLMLNNPNEFRNSSQPIIFKCLLGSEHAKSFERFLRKRYAENRKRGDWFELTDAQMTEIANLSK